MSGNWLDSSKNSNLYVQAYINGFLDVSGGNIMSRNGNLIVNAGDTSLNGRLFITSDISTNSRVLVGGDTSLNGRVFIAGDMSLSGRLFINTGTITQNAPLTSDSNFNTRLGTNSLQNTTGINNTGVGYNSGITNITGTNNTFLGANTNTTGTNFTQSTAVGYGAQITGSNQIVMGTITESTICMGDASVNGRLFINGNTTINGKTNITGTLTIQPGRSLTVSSGVTTVGLGGGGGISSTTSNMLSTDTATYGQTWSIMSSGTGLSTTAAYNSVALSSTGQYVLACTNQGSVYVSNNYGTSFITNSAFPSTYLKITGVYFGQTMTANSVYTIAGNGSLTSGSDNVLATTSGITYPYGADVDSNGNIYFTDSAAKVRFVPVLSGVYFSQTMTANFVYTIAGTGSYVTPGGDGILATTSATNPRGICTDLNGNVYVTNDGATRIRFIPKLSGTYFASSMSANFIYTIAGTSTAGTGADGISATTSQLVAPYGLTVDPSFNVYIADGSRIRMIPKTSGIYFGQTMTANFIYTIAGTVTAGAGANGILATASMINTQFGQVNVDSIGNIYISEESNHRFRFVPKTSGVYFGQTMTANFIYTIAGTGTAGTGANGILATTSTVNTPRGVAVDPTGNVYFAHLTQVRFMPINSGVYFGQTMTANFIYLLYSTSGYPASIRLDSYNNVYVADTSTFTIKMVAVASIITYNYTSTSVSSTGQYQLACANGGSTYLSTNYGNNFTSLSIAKITNAAFTTTAISSTGQYQIATTSPGSIYISNDYGNTFVQNIYGASTTAAYTATSISSTGQYQLAFVYSSGNNGSTYISANYGGSFVTPSDILLPGYISPVTGKNYGTNQYFYPESVAVDNNGSIYIADAQQNLIGFCPYKTGYYFGQSMLGPVSGQRTAYIIAGIGSWGGGTAGAGTNGVLSTLSKLSSCTGVTVDSSNNVYIGDTHCVWLIPNQSGSYFGSSMTASFIYSIAGTPGTTGAGASGQAAKNVLLNGVYALCLDSSNNIYLSDAINYRIQFIPITAGSYFGSSMSANFMYTVAGGMGNSAGTGGKLATTSAIGQVRGLCVDLTGNVYIVDQSYHRVQFVCKNSGTYFGSSMTSNWIYTIAGNGTAGTQMNIYAPSAATLNSPYGVTVDSSGNVYISDKNNSRIQFIPVTSGTYFGSIMTANFIYRVAGNGTAGTQMNIYAPSAATLNGQTGICLDNAGNIYISDQGNTLVKYISRYKSGNISTSSNMTAISSTGQYMAVGTGSTLYISTNYGYSFTPSSNTAIYANSISVSSTGQYMVVGTGSTLYISTNYGQTFTANPTGAPSSINYQTSAISSTGKYMIAATSPGALYLSSPPLVSKTTTNLTGLVTMTDLSMSGNLYTPTLVTSNVSQVTTGIVQSTFCQNFTKINTDNFSQMVMSSTGQYLLGYVNNGPIYTSSNYGKNWTATYMTGTNGSPGTVSMSSNGQYMYSAADRNGYYSLDYGATWTWNPYNLTSISYPRLTMSSTGQYAYMENYPYIIKSSNYLKTWTPISITGLVITTCSISSTGQYVIIQSNNNVYSSTDYGISWSFLLATVGSSGANGAAMSDDGKYILLQATYTLLSTNYGKTFNNIASQIWGNSAYPINSYYPTNNCAMSFTGQYMLMLSFGGFYIIYSTDYGKTWTFTTAPMQLGQPQISIDGRFVISSYGSQSIIMSTSTMTQSINTSPFTNIKGYVGFTDASGSATGADAKALVEINGVGNLTQTYQNALYTDNYSLYTSGSVLIGQNLNVASDRRIKTNIQDVNDVSALSVLRQLQPKKYTYIDTKNRGTEPVWGYIAQDVKAIVDYAVKTVTDYIPNIYYNVTITGNILTLPPKTRMITQYDESGNPLPDTEYTDPMIPTTDNFTQNDDPTTPIQIKLIDTESRRVITTTISYIQDKQNIVVADDLSQYQKLFLYGQRVTDFNVLDKNAVFTIATAALQEVDQELQELKAQVEDLESQISALE